MSSDKMCSEFKAGSSGMIVLLSRSAKLFSRDSQQICIRSYSALSAQNGHLHFVRTATTGSQSKKPAEFSYRRTLLLEQFRSRGSLPINTLINFVPQQEAWVIERMGRYFKILTPGLNFLLPVIDRIRYVQSLKEIAIEVPQQSAITVDNVALQIDGVLYLKVEDPYKASYGVEDPEFAITQLAQTTMRSEVGKIILDTVFRERETLNDSIVMAINKASEPWGISCKRYEIRDMKMPPKIQEAMQMQVEAERKKRAAILESEGVRGAEINVAEGRKRATILKSEADKQERINIATGEAEAMLARAKARAASIDIVSTSLQTNPDGHNAATFAVAEQYVKAFGHIAKENNTLILPANAADASGMVAQALTVYKNLVGRPGDEKFSAQKPFSKVDNK